MVTKYLTLGHTVDSLVTEDSQQQWQFPRRMSKRLSISRMSLSGVLFVENRIMSPDEHSLAFSRLMLAGGGDGQRTVIWPIEMVPHLQKVCLHSISFVARLIPSVK